MSKRSPPSIRRGLLAALGVLLAEAALAQAPASPPSATAAQDIHDIRGPKPIPSAWWVPPLLVGGIVGLGAGCVAWAWHRRRRLVEKTPLEIALGRLDAARALIQEGNSRDYSVELSSIVREYIEDAFDIVATHFTTEEFLRHFVQTPVFALVNSQELLGDFLQSCDLAKFGGWHMTAPGMVSMMDSARRFIVESARPGAPASQARPVETADSQESYDSLPST